MSNDTPWLEPAGEDQVLDNDEQAYIGHMLGHTFQFAQFLDQGPVARLYRQLVEQAEANGLNSGLLEREVGTIVMQRLYPNMIEERLRILGQGNMQDAYINSVEVYADIIRGVTDVIAARAYDTLARLQPGDIAPDSASQALREALTRVPGLGNAQANVLVGKLEIAIDGESRKYLGEGR